MNELKKRIEAYLYQTGIPKTKFCRRLDISTAYLYKLLNGERPFSDKISAKMDKYLNEYGY